MPSSTPRLSSISSSGIFMFFPRVTASIAFFILQKQPEPVLQYSSFQDIKYEDYNRQEATHLSKFFTTCRMRAVASPRSKKVCREHKARCSQRDMACGSYKIGVPGRADGAHKVNKHQRIRNRHITGAQTTTLLIAITRVKPTTRHAVFTLLIAQFLYQ